MVFWLSSLASRAIQTSPRIISPYGSVIHDANASRRAAPVAGNPKYGRCRRSASSQQHRQSGSTNGGGAASRITRRCSGPAGTVACNSMAGCAPAADRPYVIPHRDADVLIWIPKRGKHGGWSFYSVTIPFSLILAILLLLMFFLLRLIGL